MVINYVNNERVYVKRGVDNTPVIDYERCKEHGYLHRFHHGVSYRIWIGHKITGDINIDKRVFDKIEKSFNLVFGNEEYHAFINTREASINISFSRYGELTNDDILKLSPKINMESINNYRIMTDKPDLNVTEILSGDIKKPTWEELEEAMCKIIDILLNACKGIDDEGAQIVDELDNMDTSPIYYFTGKYDFLDINYPLDYPIKVKDYSVDSDQCRVFYTAKEMIDFAEANPKAFRPKPYFEYSQEEWKITAISILINNKFSTIKMSAKLADTDNRDIIFISDDKVLGMTIDGEGDNILGSILSKTRVNAKRNIGRLMENYSDIINEFDTCEDLVDFIKSHIPKYKV